MSKAARTGGASPRGSARKAEEDATRPAQHSYVPADPPVVGVVVSGAAARGPYEAGALAEVLPWLHEQGCRPQVLAGTSSGAITAVLLAQFADLGPDAGEEVVKVWEQISQPDVFRDVWAGLMLRAENILTPQHEPAGAMLDTTPLWTTGQRLLDPDRVAKNLRDDLFGDVAIAATFCPQDASSGYTRIFVQTQRAALPVATAHAVDYVKTTLEIEHILASAAIPVAFPPVLVTTPAPYRGWYIDGGVRLNTPIKPALDLDANRIVVISSHAVRYPLPLPPTPAGTPRPNLAGSARPGAARRACRCPGG